MASYDNPPLELKRQGPRRVLAPLWERIVNAIRRRDVNGDGPATAELTLPVDAEATVPVGTEAAPPKELRLRFPIARQGYDCVSVDQYVAELEAELEALDQELAQLRGRVRAAPDLDNEFKRVGEQTSAVLIAANEQREEILRAARAEADRRVAEATSTASTVTAKTEARLREIRNETDAARGERTRLLKDVRRISAALAEVADSADQPAASPTPSA